MAHDARCGAELGETARTVTSYWAPRIEVRSSKKVDLRAADE